MTEEQEESIDLDEFSRYLTAISDGLLDQEDWRASAEAILVLLGEDPAALKAAWAAEDAEMAAWVEAIKAAQK